MACIAGYSIRRIPYSRFDKYVIIHDACVQYDIELD